MSVPAVFTLEEFADNVAVALVTHDGLDVEIGGRIGLVGKIDPLSIMVILRIAALSRILVVQVVVPEHPLAPAAQVVVQIGPPCKTALFAIIHVYRAIELFVQEERVAAEQERPPTAAIPGNKAEMVLLRPQLARVIRKIEHRNSPHVERRVMRLDFVPGYDLEVLGPDLDRGLGHIVGGDDPVGGDIRPMHRVGEFAVEPLTFDEHGRLAGAKLFRFHLAGLEIVPDMLPDPDLLHALDAHLAVRGDIT